MSILFPIDLLFILKMALKSGNTPDSLCLTVFDSWFTELLSFTVQSQRWLWSENLFRFKFHFFDHLLFISWVYWENDLQSIAFVAHLSWKLKWAFLITCRPSSVRLSVCLSVRLFTFSSSSPEPLGQFQPNLAQSILGWCEFIFVWMKGPAFLQ